jgi:SulP family sulfate permease
MENGVAASQFPERQTSPEQSSEDAADLERLGAVAAVPPFDSWRRSAEEGDKNWKSTSSLHSVKKHVTDLFKGCSDEDEDMASLWLSHYEKKKFDIWELLPPTMWLLPYIRTNLGKASDKDISLAGGLPFSLSGDAIAGLTVGVMLVPQSLAFALLAGLPVQIGLYSCFAPLLAYSVFGTIRQVQPGPTALVSLLTGQALDSWGYTSEADRIAAASLCALLVGGISVLLGVIRFGFIVDFMSHSVMAAFCSAAGVTIASSQLKNLLGIKIARKTYWWETISEILFNIHKAHTATIALGGTLLFALIFLKKWKSAGSEQQRKAHLLWRWLPTQKSSRPFKIMKLVADLSSLLSVVVGWLWGLAYRQSGVEGVQYVGEIDSSGFVFVTPGESVKGVPFDSLIITASIIAVVGFLETMAVGGKFAMQNRYEVVPNQELLALGLSNIASAVMSGYPGTGSFSRTAVNAMFGATSLVSVFITSMMVALAVFFLLPIIEYLPLASLAPIIIQGALGVISTHDFVVAFSASKAEFFVMLATFSVSLALTVKEGLLIGFVFSVMKTMHDLANPNLAVCGRLQDGSFRDLRNFPNAEIIRHAVVVRMDARLSFANSRKLKEFCARAVKVRESQKDQIQYVVIDGKSINHVDLTGCEMLEVLAESLKSRGQGLIVANLKGPAAKCCIRAGVAPILRKHGGHLCIDMEQALAIVFGHDKDGLRSQQDIKQLVKRVDDANLMINSHNGSLLSCTSAKNLASAVSPLNRVCSDSITKIGHRMPMAAAPHTGVDERFAKNGTCHETDRPLHLDKIAEENQEEGTISTAVSVKISI